MEKDFLSYYRENLQHLRESSAEFAEAFPKIAARLELDGVECRDPFVERLLEGTAFLAARVEKRLDDGYPRLIESILSALAPGALAPEPSGAVARLLPIGSDDRVRHGAWLPAGASFKAAALGSATPCTFTTAIDAPILPVDIVRAQYALRASGRLGERLSAIGPEASAFMLELEHSSNAGWADLASGEGLPLRLYPAVSPEVASNIARLFLSDLAEVWVRPAAGSGSGASGEWRRAAVVRARSPLFDGRSAPLFSAPEGTLSGLELLHAAMAHPDFFRLIDIEGLFAALSAAGLPRHAEAAFLFRRREPELVHGIMPSRCCSTACRCSTAFGGAPSASLWASATSCASCRRGGPLPTMRLQLSSASIFIRVRTTRFFRREALRRSRMSFAKTRRGSACTDALESCRPLVLADSAAATRHRMSGSRSPGPSGRPAATMCSKLPPISSAPMPICRSSCLRGRRFPWR